MGGHLVTITSAREQRLIETLMAEEGERNSYWIGAERDRNNYFTTWVTGEPISYIYYKDGRPDNYLGRENALMIYRNNNPMIKGVCYGYWNDINKDGTCNGEPFFGLENMGFICEWNGMDLRDSDGDGLYDIFETNGMYLSNGQVVYTDPNNPDSDGDGVSDYDAMGGEPVVELYKIHGEIYPCLVSHAKVYGKLPSEFIYVDGTMNTDGRRYYGGINYVPYSYSFCYDKYEKPCESVFNDETRFVDGDARIHNSYRDQLFSLDEKSLDKYTSIKIIISILVTGADSQAGECICKYFNGTGGSYGGLAEGSTREYIYATPRLGNNLFEVNSANKYFVSNMNRARIAVESVLNEYHTEAFLSLSPNMSWIGCDYYENTRSDWRQYIDVALNLGAFGIYNSADAAITLHCVYDPETKEYFMEYYYYIIDYYDFTKIKILNEMNQLGLAESYELYGVAAGVESWKESSKIDDYWMF